MEIILKNSTNIKKNNNNLNKNKTTFLYSNAMLQAILISLRNEH